MPAVLDVLRVFGERMTLSAFEFLGSALSKVVEHGNVPRPMADAHPYYALIEFDCGTEADEDAALALFETCLEQGYAHDGVMARGAVRPRNCGAAEEISETISRWTPYKKMSAASVTGTRLSLRHRRGRPQRVP